MRGGRGSGKTRTGSEVMREWIEATPGCEWAVVAPTFGDARDVCIEGPSGLLRTFGLSRGYKGWNRSYGELFLPDGGTVYCDGADDGALRIQGRNLAGLWADEVGLWKQWRLAWEESIAFAVRIDPAKIVATGTPKRGHPLVKMLMEDDSIPKTVLRTMDNAVNLSPLALADLLRRYQGTSLGAQELEGAILTVVEGALWTPDMIQVGQPPQIWSIESGGRVLVDDLHRTVVAVDPAVTYGPDSDETGIVVAGVRGDMAYVMEDASGRFASHEWAKRVAALYRTYRADMVIAEGNNGGELVRQTILSHDPTIPVRLVNASKGKMIRAEPVANKYEQGKVFHTRSFAELEDQLCTYTKESPTSPDRLDALVWALTDLMLTSPLITDAAVANV